MALHFKDSLPEYNVGQFFKEVSQRLTHLLSPHASSPFPKSSTQNCNSINKLSLPALATPRIRIPRQYPQLLLTKLITNPVRLSCTLIPSTTDAALRFCAIKLGTAEVAWQWVCFCLCFAPFPSPLSDLRTSTIQTSLSLPALVALIGVLMGVC